MSIKNDRWSALSMSERADLMNMYITNGISDLKEMKKHYNSFAPGGYIKTDEYGYPADITPAIVEADYPREAEVWKRADASNADMVLRLKQGSSRVTIPDWEDPKKVATHKMMSAGNYAIGNVQNINGQLFDFTDPKHGFKDSYRAAIDSAIERGDYIKFDTEGDARYFAEHYKKHYNSFSGEEDTESTLSGESPSKLRQNIRKAKVNVMRMLRQMQWESPSKAITKVFQDTDASRNFERNYYKNSYDDVAQDSYLFSKKEHENAFLNSGYIKGSPGDYGLVKNAVGDRNLPVYQTAKDDASRENLTVIGNISDIFFGDNKLTHAGHFPTAIYKDAEGNIYQKAWDLQNYGPDANDSEGSYSYYDKIRKVGATLLDIIGNPVVRTTGFQKLDDSGIRALLINTKDKKLWEELIATSAKPVAEEVMNSRVLGAYEDYISTEASKKATHLDPNSERYIYDFENIKEEIRKNTTFDTFKSNIEKYYSPETLEKKYFIFK